MKPSLLLLCTFVLVAPMTWACGGGKDSPSTPTAPTTVPPAAATVTSITVTGPGCTDVCPGTVGGTIQLVVTARMSDSSSQTVTAQSQWSSTNTNVATVSSGGLVTFRAAGDSDIIAVYQGRSNGSTVRIVPAGPRTSFGPGQYFVGRDIVPGRYFADPVSGCYWERQRGLGGGTGDIIANDFVGYNAGQIIVDISASDLAFKTDADCGTWNQTPRRGFAANITPGMWLVGSQVATGTYSANSSGGCYWERLRNFSGRDGIIANDFISGAVRVLVEIRSGDVGFNTDGDCGDWTRVQSQLPSSSEPAFGGSTEPNRDRQRAQVGLLPLR